MSTVISQVETAKITITPQVVTGEPIVIQITRPDKTPDTVTLTANADGTASATYTATQVGTYSGIPSIVEQDTGVVKLLAATGASAVFNVAEGQVPRQIELIWSP